MCFVEDKDKVMFAIIILITVSAALYLDHKLSVMENTYNDLVTNHNDLVEDFNNITSKYNEVVLALQGSCERCNLYTTNLTEKAIGPTGVYFHEKYYCVWVGGRTKEEIASTEEHEVCHALIGVNPTHFCKEEKNVS